MECNRCNFQVDTSDTRCSRCDFELPEIKKSFLDKLNFFNRGKKEENVQKFDNITDAISVKASLKESIKEISGTHKAVTEDLIAEEIIAKDTVNKANQAVEEEIIATESNTKNIEAHIETMQDHTEQVKSLLDELAGAEITEVETTQVVEPVKNSIEKDLNEPESIEIETKESKTSETLDQSEINDLTESLEDLINSVPEVQVKKETETIEEALLGAEKEETEQVNTAQNVKVETTKLNESAKEQISETSEETQAYELNMDEELDLDSLLKEFE